MAEFIVAGLAVVSTPPALFAFEQLNDALIGKKEEQKPRNVAKGNAGDTEDVLPNLLKPRNAVKGKEDRKPHNGEAKDTLPTLLKAKNVVQDDAGEKEEQKAQLGVKNVVKCNAFAPEFSPKTSSRSTTIDIETKPKLPFSVVEHAATNPYLLKIPSRHHNMEQDRSRIVEEDELMKRIMKSIMKRRMKKEEHYEEDVTNSHLLKVPSSHHMEKDRSRIVEEEEHDVTHHMEKDTTSMSLFWYFR